VASVIDPEVIEVRSGLVIDNRATQRQGFDNKWEK